MADEDKIDNKDTSEKNSVDSDFPNLKDVRYTNITSLNEKFPEENVSDTPNPNESVNFDTLQELLSNIKSNLKSLDDHIPDNLQLCTPEEEEEKTRFRHDLLLHQYDAEMQRTANIRSRATFLFGVIGLCLTIGITVCTADSFVITNACGLTRFLYLSYGVVLLVALVLTAGVYFRMDKSWTNISYPKHSHLLDLQKPHLKLRDPILPSMTDELSSIIQVCRNGNDENVEWINASYTVLLLTFLPSVFLIISLILGAESTILQVFTALWNWIIFIVGFGYYIKKKRPLAYIRSIIKILTLKKFLIMLVAFTTIYIVLMMVIMLIFIELDISSLIVNLTNSNI